MPDQLIAVTRDGIDRPGVLRLISEAIDHRGHTILVRQRDVGPQVVIAAQGGNGLREIDRRCVDRFVGGIDPCGLEGGSL